MYLDRTVREKKKNADVPASGNEKIFDSIYQLLFKLFLGILQYRQGIKNEEKCFLLHLKSSFCSQDI